MTSAFLYLTWCTIRNRMRVRLRRLREPRYLVGTVVGALYFYFFLFRQPQSPRREGGSPGIIALLDRFRGVAELAGSLVLFAVALLAWVVPRGATPLAFTPSEVQFLFAAPVARSELIRYKVIRSQLAVFLSSALMTLFFRPASAGAGGRFFLGSTLLMVVVNMYSMGVALRRQGLAAQDTAGRMSQRLPLVILIAAAGVLVGTAAWHWRDLAGLGAPLAMISELQRITEHGPAAVVLWPFRTLVRVPLAATGRDLILALPAALLLLVLAYRWVIRSDVAFEEASAAAAEKVATRSAAGASPVTPTVRPRPAPFALASTGPVEVALLWKNLIMMSRYASMVTLLRLLPAVVVLGVIMAQASGSSGFALGAALVALWIGGFTILFGPQMVTADLRRDLAHMAVIKTWPVRGASLVRGELAAPAAVLSAIACLSTLAAWIFGLQLSASVIDWSWVDVTGAGVAALLLAPLVILVQLLFHNALAVMFPAWVVTTGARGAGVEVMGQRMVMLAAMFLVVAIALAPAVLAGGLAAYVVRPLAGGLWMPVGAVVAATVLAIECAFASEAIGAVMDRTDISSL